MHFINPHPTFKTKLNLPWWLLKLQEAMLAKEFCGSLHELQNHAACQQSWVPKTDSPETYSVKKAKDIKNIDKHSEKLLKVAFTIVSGIHHSSRCWLFGNSILLHARVHGAISNHQFVSVALRPRATRINDQRYGPAMERCTTHQSGSTIQVIKCIFEAGGDRLAF